MSGDAPLLQLEGITVRRGKMTVLESVDLTVNSGEVVILRGENGAGKSTLLEAAAGILNLQTGSVIHSGDLVRDSDGRRNCPPPFGLTLQSGGYSNDELVRERIETAATAAGHLPNSEWVNRHLSTWGLRHRAEDRIAWLSGGMRRKVGIIAGLTPASASKKPRLVLLDEPSEGLDEASISTLKSEIARLSAAGHSILISTHDEGLYPLASSTYNVGEKKIHKEGKPTLGEGEGATQKVEDGGSENLPHRAKKLLRSPPFEWAANLEARTLNTTINRFLAGLIALAVIGGMIAQIPPPTGRPWLALLALTPALISALVKPGHLAHLHDSRAGDWWNAQLGRPLQMLPLLPVMVVIPFGLTLMASWFVFGEITAPAVSIAAGMALLTFGAEKIYALESTFPRQGASLILLVLVILIWPFLLSVDLLALSPSEFTGRDVWTQLLTTYVVPVAVWIAIPMLSPE